MCHKPPLIVVGVLPPGFEFPTGPMDYYRPFDRSRPPGQVPLIGRLRDGVSLSAAMDEAHVIGTATRPPRPTNAPPLPVPRFEVQRLKDALVRSCDQPFACSSRLAVVLMIVCANIANLLLARGLRASARSRCERRSVPVVGESSVRSSRSASCWRLRGALGALLGAAGVALVKRLASVEAPGIFRLGLGASILPRANEIRIGLKTFGTAFGVAVMASLDLWRRACPAPVAAKSPPGHGNPRRRLRAMERRGFVRHWSSDSS